MDIRDALFDSIYEYAKIDSDLIILSGDMDAFSLKKFHKDFPERYINVGVAEQNMINFAAGLAISGKKVICYGISPFVTMRCFEQIKINIASHNLPVTLIGAGTGYAFGNDGLTHHATIDLAVMRLIPEFDIYDISSIDVAANCIDYVFKKKTPSYIRLDKGAFPFFEHKDSVFMNGFRVLRPITDHLLITSGYMTQEGLRIADQLYNQGYKIGVIDLFNVKNPGDELLKHITLANSIYIYEENCRTGGIGSMISDYLVDNNISKRIFVLSSKNKQYIEPGNRQWFFKKNDLDIAACIEFIKSKWCSDE